MYVSLRQLEYFAALARTLNFRVAAEECHVTQPALSTQLRQLEKALGTDLFERSRRTVAMTDAGRRLLPRAHRILDEVEGLRRDATVGSAPLTGTLRLGVIPTIAPYVLPRFVPVAKRRYPDLRLLILEERTPELVRRLHASELDVLLVALEANLGEAVTLPLYLDPFVLACPEDHPMAAQRAVRPRDLQGQELLLLEDGHCLRDQVLDVCAMARASEVGDFRASSLNTLARMVAAGTGITLLPEMARSVEVRPRDKIVIRPFGKRGPARTIGLAWRKTTTRVDEFEMLAELLRETAPVDPA